MSESSRQERRKPSKWCASNYTNAITLKKLTDENVRWPRGTYHDTWEEAHAALVARREREFQAAEREFQRCRNALSKAKMMKPPKRRPESSPLSKRLMALE